MPVARGPASAGADLIAGGPSSICPRDYEPLPVSRPETWLLREGWRRYGLIDPHECPGPLEHTARW